MIKVKSYGSFFNTERLFNNIDKLKVYNIIKKEAENGIEALKYRTPRDTGLTKHSWTYKIEEYDGMMRLQYFNHNNSGGLNVAILIQYGHGTKHGAFVDPYNYITPSLSPVFKAIADKIWNEVIK